MGSSRLARSRGRVAVRVMVAFPGATPATGIRGERRPRCRPVVEDHDGCRPAVPAGGFLPEVDQPPGLEDVMGGFPPSATIPRTDRQEAIAGCTRRGSRPVAELAPASRLAQPSPIGVAETEARVRHSAVDQFPPVDGKAQPVAGRLKMGTEHGRPARLEPVAGVLADGLASVATFPRVTDNEGSSLSGRSAN